MNDTPMNPADMDGDPLTNQTSGQTAQGGMDRNGDRNGDTSQSASANGQGNQGQGQGQGQGQDQLGQQPMGGPDASAMTGEGRGGVAGLGSYGGDLNSGPMESSGTLDRQGANDAASNSQGSGGLNETLMGDDQTNPTSSMGEGY